MEERGKICVNEKGSGGAREEEVLEAGECKWSGFNNFVIEHNTADAVFG